MRKSFNVVVTGAAVCKNNACDPDTVWKADRVQPFKEWSYNTSAMVRDAIPDQITRKGKLPINILKYPHNIGCIYADVLALIPELWSGKRSVYQPHAASEDEIAIDLMIHIGMNSAEESNYVIEKRARRDGYEQPGEDGQYLPPDALKGLPKEIFVGFDVEDIVARVANSLPVPV